jgi:coproporphyrinogen III oxidase-like Fe-S oxidoreductase
VEELDESVRGRERVMLGLRLDEGVPLARAASSVDRAGLGRLERLGLVARRTGRGSPGALVLTPRGRRLGSAVTAELLI